MCRTVLISSPKPHCFFMVSEAVWARTHRTETLSWILLNVTVSENNYENIWDLQSFVCV